MAKKDIRKNLRGKALKEDRVLSEMTGGEYIPIEKIEDRLDEIFDHNWSVRWVQPPHMIAANALQCSIELEVTFKIGNKEITICRPGCATIILRINLATKLPSQSSLVYADKAAKSLALANAARSLGNRFGRSLNRDRETPDEQNKVAPLNV